MTKRTQRAFTAIIIVFLLVLFTLPGVCLRNAVSEMLTVTAEAEAAALSGGDPSLALVRLQRLYERHSVFWKMFLDHVSVDAAGAAIEACTPLSEPDALVSALHTVNAALRHLLGIEKLTASSLL